MANKLTRKQAKQLTRQRLIDALLRIARAEGLQGLTTTKIAETAGVAQSSFYVHFEGMDDAMSAAAAYLGAQIQDAIRAERQRIVLEDRSSLDALRRTYEASLRAFLSEPVLAALFLQHRRDPQSPLGTSFRRLMDGARADLLTDIQRMGVELPHLEVYVELLIGMNLAVVEGLVDGRLTDRAACIDALVQVVGATIMPTMPLDQPRAR